MKSAGWLRSVYLSRFSQPQQDRIIYRALSRSRVTSVLEIGIGTGVRTGRALELALMNAAAGRVRYIGVDLFEARDDRRSHLTLKQAHQVLVDKRISARLIPGDPYTALSQTANSLGCIDLVIVSADQDQDSLSRAWFYLPRLLHQESLVFVERATAEGNTIHQLSAAEIAALAHAAPRPCRHAA